MHAMKTNIVLGLIAALCIGILLARWWQWRNEWVPVNLPMTLEGGKTYWFVFKDGTGTELTPKSVIYDSQILIQRKNYTKNARVIKSP